MGAAVNGRYVSVEPFQKRFLELEEVGVTAADVARSLGWFTHKGGADGPRVRRTVGLRQSHDVRRPPHLRKHVQIATAKRLCVALEMDPEEVGLPKKRRKEMVSNAGLRREFLRLRERGEVHESIVAVRLGWMKAGRNDDKPDTTRVLRALGLAPATGGSERSNGDGNGYSYSSRLRQELTWKNAGLMCYAIGCDPWNADL